MPSNRQHAMPEIYQDDVPKTAASSPPPPPNGPDSHPIPQVQEWTSSFW